HRDAIFTLEEHSIHGGFGAAVLEAASEIAGDAEEALARVVTLAVPDRWIEHASSREEQLKQVGLDAEAIRTRVEAALGRGTRAAAGIRGTGRAPPTRPDRRRSPQGPRGAPRRRARARARHAMRRRRYRSRRQARPPPREGGPDPRARRRRLDPADRP